MILLILTILLQNVYTRKIIEYTIIFPNTVVYYICLYGAPSWSVLQTLIKSQRLRKLRELQIITIRGHRQYCIYFVFTPCMIQSNCICIFKLLNLNTTSLLSVNFLSNVLSYYSYYIFKRYFQLLSLMCSFFR